MARLIASTQYHASLVWHKSTASAQGNCVEVAIADDAVLVRDSKDQEGTLLSFADSSWGNFIQAVRSDELG